MCPRLDHWLKILSKPRRFLRGDSIPEAICDQTSGVKLMLLLFAVGHMIPFPAPGLGTVVTGAGVAMMHPSSKRKAIRWAADKFRFRHVAVREDGSSSSASEHSASGGTLIRAEINSVSSEITWLPVAVYRLREGELSFGNLQENDDSRPDVSVDETDHVGR